MGKGALESPLGVNRAVSLLWRRTATPGGGRRGRRGPAFALGGIENKHVVAVTISKKTSGGDTPSVDFAHNDAEAMKRFVLAALGYRDGNSTGSGRADSIAPRAESALLKEETS